MPGYDFAALTEEREPFAITLSYKRDENGAIIRDAEGNGVPDDQVILPPVLPAKLMLQFFHKDREELQKIADSPADVMKVGMSVIEELVGKEEWDHVLETIGFGNIEPLLTDIFEYYGMSAKKEEGDGSEGEGKAEPESQSITSSTTSEPSTPISNGSIPEPTNVSTISPSGGLPFSPESDTYQPKASS